MRIAPAAVSLDPRAWLRNKVVVCFPALLLWACSGMSLEGEAVLEFEDELASSVVASFQNGVSPASYAGTVDATLVESTPTVLGGNDVLLRLDRDYPSNSGQSSNGLLKFDLSSLQPGSTIQSVKLTVNVVSPTTGTDPFVLYAANRGWNEAQVTWQRSDSATSWATGGARGAADRLSAPLGNLLPTSAGKYTVSLNAEGVKRVQAWVNDPASNRGFVLDAEKNMDGLTFDSSEATLPANRPQLSVTYAPPEIQYSAGLTGEYFAGTHFQTLVSRRTDATVDFSWGSGSPGAGIPVDDFSVRWTGKVVPLYSQNYTFYTQSDDGIRLWVNGQKVIDLWTAHSSTESKSVTLALKAGQKYDLKLEYYDSGYQAVAQLLWSSSSQAKQVIPVSQLFSLPLVTETPTPTPAPTPTPPVQPGPVIPMDEDGVQMMLPAAQGASWRLGSANPNGLANFQIENRSEAKPFTEGGVKYWRVPASTLNYANGMTGISSRLHILANGGTQLYTWKNTPGFLSSNKDIKNYEFTLYTRMTGFENISQNLTFAALKIRGGHHTASNGDQASCTMMDIRPLVSGAEKTVRFAKELFHPNYDYVTLPPATTAGMVDGAWVGLKMVSYAPQGTTDRIVNRLYIDTDPWTSAGKPRNTWKLLGEYIDIEGKSTGKYYSRLANWGGWKTTFRVDGVRTIDFAIMSVREVAAP